MKPAFFSRLAADGIRKNQKLYTPYILSCIGMVGMFYILCSLSYSPYVQGIKHGGDLAFILSLGKFVVGAFALLFLFYTNSFLVKRRYREFGLYSILGMDRKGNTKIVVWESVVVAGIGLAGGLVVGILLSKLAELGLLKMTGEQAGLDLTVAKEAVEYTVLVFAVIFLLLTLKSVLKIRRCKPIELMRSEHEGEKPVRANWVLAVLGVLILGAAYFMAVSIDNPIEALLYFFVAVIMVILGTYLLFMAGSVALCRILQKKKDYYYTPKHFVAVSSMSYRMKRNGAGLASICILVTMVLVMISSTASLYFGADDAMRTRFPRDVGFSIRLRSVDAMTDETVGKIDRAMEQACSDHGFTPRDPGACLYASVSGRLERDTLYPDPSYDTFVADFSGIRTVYFISQRQYNEEMGTQLSLQPGEAALYTLRTKYTPDTLNIDGVSFRIVQRTDAVPAIPDAETNFVPSLVAVIYDYSELKPLDRMLYEGESMLECMYYFGYSSAGDEAQTLEVYRQQLNALSGILEADEDGVGYRGGCLFLERDDFYSSFGGLFFLGIVLSIVFTFAAAVIIYYKQVSEGYEDQKRFEIMQNVGMTRENIRQTINAQVITVFFAPLTLAGIHLCFAFPFIWKILIAFNLRNMGFIILVTAIAFVAFGLFYALIYRITSGNYYAIVRKD